MPVNQLRLNIIDAVREKIRFSDNIGRPVIGPNNIQLSDRIFVKRKRTFKCGSVFANMKEMALVGGFLLEDPDDDLSSIKVLVVYLERPLSIDGVHDFDIVDFDRCKPVKHSEA